MVRMTQGIGMLMLAWTFTGCAQLFDYVDATCQQLKCEHQAKIAWMEARELYCNVSHPYNFGEGFRDGYVDVCLGNDSGCAPPMPPRRYWSSCYMNCDGKAKSIAWFDGYAHGSLAASCSGCNAHSQVATGFGGNGSGEAGSALKGYRPPIRNPYGYERDHDVDQYDLAPTPRILTPNPSADGPTDKDLFPEDDGDLMPQAPLDPDFPLDIKHDGISPRLPSAEVYRTPVF